MTPTDPNVARMLAGLSARARKRWQAHVDALERQGIARGDAERRALAKLTDLGEADAMLSPNGDDDDVDPASNE